MSTNLNLQYWQDDGWFVGRLQGVPEVFSQGKTLAELEENIRDAFRLMMEDEPQPADGALTKSLTIDA
ncbi:MAG TPA: type II toxin-antitoxin system HicB family antitoxin [Pirellulales bacterium]|jgi:predicted RNase H-like HicB family nuclease|nr:type II toxin-antitoxin system HicB family antitoxin [Pirellulales bacterium]